MFARRAATDFCLGCCGLKWDEGAQNFDERAKVFPRTASVSAHRSDVSFAAGLCSGCVRAAELSKLTGEQPREY